MDPNAVAVAAPRKFEYGTFIALALIHLGALAAPFFFSWAGLALLVVGVLREVRTGSPGDGDSSPAQRGIRPAPPGLPAPPEDRR